jgi:hypothetical protein
VLHVRQRPRAAREKVAERPPESPEAGGVEVVSGPEFV